MPFDPLYADSTSDYLAGQNQANVPEPAAPAPSTSLTSIARAAGRGFGQGAANLAGAAADTAAGLSQIYSDPDQALLNPSLQEADDQRINKAIAAGKAGHLFESRAGTAAYDFASTLKPDPTNTTAIDQVVQGAVAGLTQIVPAAVLGGPLAGAAVGGASIGLGRAEDLKREGVDVGTRTAVGAVEGTLGGLGAVLPVGGSTLARTAGLVAIGGPGLTVVQGSAEKAILKNSNYDHLADQIDPLDPVNLAASTLIAGAFGGAHVVGAKRAASAAETAAKPATPGAAPSVPITEMSVDARKALPFNSPSLDAYAQQAAQAAGVPPEMLLFIKNRGERSNSNQVSPAGAKGVMQFTDDTFRAFGKGDPKDPVNSIDAAAAYAADLLKRYDGDMRAAITEYNGGVKQAQAVHAGGKPTDPETIAYLKRFDEYAANHQITNATFDPTPAQTDAAFLAHGQRIVDDAHIGPADDVASMATHQDAFELAARQMDAGEPVDVLDRVPPELMSGDVLGRYARDIGAARAAEVDGQSTLFRNGDSRTFSIKGGEEITVEKQHARGSGAMPDGYVPRETDPAEFIARNRSGDEIGKLAFSPGDRAIDSFVHDRYRRRGIGTILYDLAESHGAVLKGGESLGTVSDDARALRAFREQRSQTDSSGVPNEAKASVPQASGEAASGQERQSPIEQSVRQTALERPDTVVHVDANAGHQEGSIGDILRTIDEEHQNTLQDASLLQVAANCFIGSGD